MDLWSIYEKFNQVKTWLSGPGADALEKFIEINDKITDAARQIQDYLRSLDAQGRGALTASMSVEDSRAMEKLIEIKAEFEEMSKAPSARAIPGLKELLAVVVAELIKKLLDRWGGSSVKGQPATV